MTLEDYCISLNLNKIFLVVLGVVDMYHNLLNIELMISQIPIQDSDRIISVVLKSGLPMFFVLYSTIFNL